MLNRLLLFVVAILTVAARVSSAQTTLHQRQAPLPPMVTSLADVERLMTELAAMSNTFAPGDEPLPGDQQVTIRAKGADGRLVERNVRTSQAVDTLRHLLASIPGFTMLNVQLHGSAAYTVAGVVHQPRLGNALFTLVAWPGRERSGYIVSGFDSATVATAAAHIERFGKTFVTWRGPKAGEMIQLAAKLLALLLLPIGFALRDRRGAWLLYPVSAALFVASYAVPIASAFPNWRIIVAG